MLERIIERRWTQINADKFILQETRKRYIPILYFRFWVLDFGLETWIPSLFQQFELRQPMPIWY
jgi:hypothetical protein